jgi:rhodanese-related sulfurtransferase
MDDRVRAWHGGAEPQAGQLDPQVPNAARMYDYYLGGSANLAVDREAAEQLMAAVPDIVYCAHANRAYLGRVVRYLTEQGIDQFLDLGSGIPTVGNVHEIAHRHDPAARVAYVDIEPVAVSYARRLLADEPLVTVTRADIRDPRSVLYAPGVSDLLDFDRPVAVLAVAILHAMSDADDPAGFLAAYRSACAPGSHLAISHLSPLTFEPAQVRVSEEVYARTPTPVVYRDRDRIAKFLDGYQPVDPGLVLLPQWRPTDPVDEVEARRANSYGAVGRLP